MHKRHSLSCSQPHACDRSRQSSSYADKAAPTNLIIIVGIQAGFQECLDASSVSLPVNGPNGVAVGAPLQACMAGMVPCCATHVTI